ncbi:MAG TPA: HD domain-containing phosphohydrolase [Balneolales bacterium]|nr:HD domain-containing phosphohydrolase [Balneolales bacterium]
MIRDVKNYIQNVFGKLSDSFRIEDFSVEKEAMFWNISAEYLSQIRPTKFNNIIRWVDLLYEAPVHVVYRLQNEKSLRLLYQHIIPRNKKQLRKAGDLIEKERKSNVNIESIFEQQVNNIQTKIAFKDSYKGFGRINLSIGNCECLPLYKGDDFWGIYCVGPFVAHPEAMDAKISIVARTLSKLIIDSEEEKKKDVNKFESNATEQIDSFGFGTLNINKVSRFFIQYLSQYYSAAGGAIFEHQNDQLMVLANHKIPQDIIVKISSAYRFNDKLTMERSNERVNELTNLLHRSGIWSYTITPFAFNQKRGFIFLGFKNEQVKHDPEVNRLVKRLSGVFGNLIDFKDRNDELTDNIIETYYELIRGIEKSESDTYYHSPRVVALADQFATYLGLDAADKKTLMTAAKLHDLGYVGALELNESAGIGTEIRHPIIGELMVKMLPVNQEVKNGVRQHHEWVNGTGTPSGLNGNEISWTGKILGIIEYTAEYIDRYQNNKKNKGEELHDQLIKNLLERTDQQFDMVLVPIAVNILKTLTWKDCVELGTK